MFSVVGLVHHVFCSLLLLRGSPQVLIHTLISNSRMIVLLLRFLAAMNRSLEKMALGIHIAVGFRVCITAVFLGVQIYSQVALDV